MIKKLIDRFLPPKNVKFFTSFEKNISVCLTAGNLLYEAIKNGITYKNLEEMRILKHKSNDISNELLLLLNLTLITPIEREDIQKISIMLNKITLKISRSLFISKTYDIKIPNYKMLEQIEVLNESILELKNVIFNLKSMKNTNELISIHKRMKTLETKGDDIFSNSISDLMSGKFSAIEIIKYMDIYKNIEKALDDCFLISCELLNIHLKYS